MKSNIIKGLHSDKYDAVEAERSSSLKTVYNDSVERLLAKEKKDSPALRFGRALHTLILEPHLKDEIIVKPAFPKAGKGITKEIKENNKQLEEIFLTQHAGKWITNDEFKTINEMQNALYSSKNTDTDFLLSSKDADNELSAFGNEPTTGIACKARIDKAFLQHGVWVDYKTTQCSEPKAFMRDAVKYDYDLSAAFHADTLEWAHDEMDTDMLFSQVDTWLWLVQEKEPPYLSNIIEVPRSMIEIGRKKYIAALEKVKSHKEGFKKHYTGNIITGGESELYIPCYYFNNN